MTVATRRKARPPLSVDDMKAMTERDLQRNVVQLARDLGWGVSQAAATKVAAEAESYGQPVPPLDGLVFHPRYSMGSEPGWPDLTLIRRRDQRLIFAELKTEKGRLHPRQEAVLELLSVFAANRSWWDDDLSVADWNANRAAAWSPTPLLEVWVWRPSDLGAIAEDLR